MASSRLSFLLFWTDAAAAAGKPVDLLMIRSARLVYTHYIYIRTYTKKIELKKKNYKRIIYCPKR